MDILFAVFIPTLLALGDEVYKHANISVINDPSFIWVSGCQI
jgi:hypothetical protein